MGRPGYHVVPGQRRRGHAAQMLAQAKPVCQQLRLTEILVTCAEDNLASRRVIEANGGALDRIVDGEPTTGSERLDVTGPGARGCANASVG